MYRSTSLSMLALALTCIAQPSAAQDAGSCVDEVQRLSEGLPVLHASGREDAAALAQEPGARRGASLGKEQRQQITALVEQARTAGEQGDGGRCMQGLTEARALLREAGFGSGQPGATTDVGLGTGLARRGAAGVGGASSPATSPGAGAAATTGVGAATTGVGGAATDVGPGTSGVGTATTGVGPATTGTGAATTGTGAATTGAGAAGGAGTLGGGTAGGAVGGGAAGGAGSTGGVAR